MGNRSFARVKTWLLLFPCALHPVNRFAHKHAMAEIVEYPQNQADAAEPVPEAWRGEALRSARPGCIPELTVHACANLRTGMQKKCPRSNPPRIPSRPTLRAEPTLSFRAKREILFFEKGHSSRPPQNTDERRRTRDEGRKSAGFPPGNILPNSAGHSIIPP